jgi:hypothetical protein
VNSLNYSFTSTSFCNYIPHTWEYNQLPNCVNHFGTCCAGILVGKLEEKRPLRRPRSRWEDNNKIDLRETGWDGIT